MAGHSKWANIQHRKGAQDAKRGKLFTKLIREVSIAARLGGGDPAANSRLRLAIDKALSGNVPKDTIERAIKRASGDQNADNIEEVRYEGYGPGGVAVMVDCMTDNRNRTVADVRHAFTKFGGNLGTDGSVSYLFTKLGQISYPSGSDEDRVMEAALEAGADDIVNNDDGSIDVLTAADSFPEVRDAMVAMDLTPEQAEVTMRASTSVSLSSDDAQTMIKLLETLEDHDDVQQVYSNAEISDEILAEIS
jgi:YebC/PmpR family DNA-binding regulatory protein